ncbi:MAG: TIGR03620 family F420-dependent LLM class oxidoreductase [Hyphomicrobiales bacterium]|nr:MAG: TIGR03620 family F420-dependent LLM class oxidoreductase [Hyphomicrobiales bacterium]
MTQVQADIELGSIGIWSSSIRFAPTEAALQATRELEALGFESLWIPGGIDDGVLGCLEPLLAGTDKLRIATGIINIWKQPAADVAKWFLAQSPETQARVLLGVGVSHGPIIGEAWAKPVAKMRAYLDELDAAGVPTDRICVAALGPKMLELSALRTAGAHPYMVTASHTAFARSIMGRDALLAPELGVVLETDPDKARAIARGIVEPYSKLPNYANNWLRDGFSKHEIDSLDDRLIDAVIAWGDLSAIKARIDEYHDAGANHVCLQAIGPAGMIADLDHDLSDWRMLAKLL